MPKTDIPFETLAADLHGSDWAKRCDAARLLGQSKDPRAVALLLPDLQDPDWRVRRNAVQALGALKSPEATLPLIAALQDRTATVRERAAIGLGRIKDPQAISALLEAFTRTDKLQIGNAAYQALRKFGRKAVPILIETFQQTPRSYLINLLVEAKAAGLVELLLPHITSSDMVMRTTAIQALGNLSDARIADALLEYLPGADLPTQITIIHALGHLKAEQALPTLLDMLHNGDLYGQHTSMYRAITDALQNMSGIKSQIEDAFPVGGPIMNVGGTNIDLAETMGLLSNAHFAELNSMLANMENKIFEMGKQFNLPDAAVEGMADRTWGYGAMLADARDAKSVRVKVLLNLLESAAALTRIAAAVSLVWYNDAQALPPLEQAMHDPDSDVRRAAAWAHQALKRTLGYLDDLSAR